MAAGTGSENKVAHGVPREGRRVLQEDQIERAVQLLLNRGSPANQAVVHEKASVPQGVVDRRPTIANSIVGSLRKARGQAHQP